MALVITYVVKMPMPPRSFGNRLIVVFISSNDIACYYSIIFYCSSFVKLVEVKFVNFVAKSLLGFFSHSHNLNLDYYLRPQNVSLKNV